MSWTFCTSGAAVANAGLNQNSVVGTSGGLMTSWSDESEGWIEQETRRKWLASFSTLDTGTQNALSDVCASRIAMRIISHDSTGYLRREADLLMNLNDDRVTKGLQVLKDFKSSSLQVV